jgi:hypothetical protein
VLQFLNGVSDHLGVVLPKAAHFDRLRAAGRLDPEGREQDAVRHSDRRDLAEVDDLLRRPENAPLLIVEAIRLNAKGSREEEVARGKTTGLVNLRHGETPRSGDGTMMQLATTGRKESTARYLAVPH